MAELSPVTVWMVNLIADEVDHDVKGRLELDGDRLLFSGRREAVGLVIAVDRMRRVKRLRASPVLLVEWETGDGPRGTAFYFSQPPPLHVPAPGGVAPDPMARGRLGPFGALQRRSKRRHQKTNIHYLQTQGLNLRPTIQAWADELNARRGAAQRRTPGS